AQVVGLASTCAQCRAIQDDLVATTGKRQVIGTSRTDCQCASIGNQWCGDASGEAWIVDGSDAERTTEGDTGASRDVVAAGDRDAGVCQVGVGDKTSTK